ncbi:hypothetical protein BDZ88DRAFT_101495 [Geranomyces variabilis]|nr:hypothetical protein BDZ88DRAFT_101495 [Geranomyces variabilis]
MLWNIDVSLSIISKGQYFYSEPIDSPHRAVDPVVPLLSLALEDDVFEHAKTAAEILAVSEEMIREFNNKFPLTLKKSVRKKCVLRIGERLDESWVTSAVVGLSYEAFVGRFDHLTKFAGLYERTTLYCLRRYAVDLMAKNKVADVDLKQTAGHNPCSIVFQISKLTHRETPRPVTRWR